MAQSKRKKRRRRERKQRRHETAVAEPAPAAADAAATPAAERPKRRRRERPGPPPAPWGSFPLVELIVLVAIGMVIAGFAFASGDRQVALVLVGLGLGSLAGLEVAVREHFAGYRSHTLLLAAVPAAIALGLLLAFAGSLPALARVGVAAAVFALAVLVLTRAFRARSGGHAFKISTRTP